LLKVQDPASGNTFYSAYVSGMTTTNITPLTHLALANALGADPATTFSAFSATPAQALTSTNLSNAATLVSTGLSTLGLSVSGNSFTTGFTAATEAVVGTGQDPQVDGLMFSLSGGSATVSVALQNFTQAMTTATTTTIASAVQALTLPTVLSGCPYALSGNYLAVVAGQSGLLPVKFSFGATKTASFNGQSPATLVQSGTQACEFSAGGYTYSVARDGFVLISSGNGSVASPSSPASISGTNVLGMAVPVQSAFALTGATGTWNVLSFVNGAYSATANTTDWQNQFAQFSLNGTAGLGQMTPCTVTTGASMTCTGAATSYTLNRVASNRYTLLASGGTTTPSAWDTVLYQSPNGDLILLGVASAPAATANGVMVGALRAVPYPLRSVSSTYSASTFVLAGCASAPYFALCDDGSPLTVTVTASTPATNNSSVAGSLYRSYTVGGLVAQDQVLFNLPYAGMQYSAGSSTSSAWVGISGLGWTVIGSTSTLTPYVGISVLYN
jgi:hypothetical protein